MALYRVDLVPPAGVPEDAGEGSAYDADGASNSGIDRDRNSAKNHPSALARLRFSDSSSDASAHREPKTQADERVAQAVIFPFDGNAQDLRAGKGLGATCL